MSTPPQSKPCVGITIGDPAGIGPEVIAKSLQSDSIKRLGSYKIIGDKDLLPFKIFKGSRCSLIDLNQSLKGKFKMGHPNRFSARASLNYLNKAIDLLKIKEIDCLVTAPVSKEAISSLGERFEGHTEYLAKAFGVQEYEMMFVSPKLRTIIVTRHIPLKDVSQTITPRKVYQTICLAEKALKRYFRIRKPRVAICGINPHAGEGGTIGHEEKTKIIPAVHKAQQKGMDVLGPLAADTIFIPHIAPKFDCIIAMYHDQGLIPIKTQYFGQTVNLTIGLPFIRTSPAHGPAFDIAGQNKADPSSMSEAIRLACQLSKIPKDRLLF